jgi:hypothetical protein
MPLSGRCHARRAAEIGSALDANIKRTYMIIVADPHSLLNRENSLFSGKLAVAGPTFQRHERGCLAAPSLLLLHFGSGIEEFQRLDPDLFQLARVRERPPVVGRVDPAEPG